MVAQGDSSPSPGLAWLYLSFPNLKTQQQPHCAQSPVLRLSLPIQYTACLLQVPRDAWWDSSQVHSHRDTLGSFLFH